MDREGREECDATDGVGVDLSFDEPGLDNGGARRCCFIRREVEPISKLMKSLKKTYTAREARWTSTDWRSSFERTRKVSTEQRSGRILTIDFTLLLFLCW